MFAVALVPWTMTVPSCGVPVAVVAHDVGAARRLEVRRACPASRDPGSSTGGRVRCSATIGHVRSRSAAPSSTGTSLYSHGCRLMIVPVGEELRHAGREDAEVRAAVLGRLRAGVAGDPDHLADLQLAVLRQLAEEAHRAVLQVGEGAVGRARAPEAVELAARGRRRSSPSPCRPACRSWRTR